MTWMTMLSKEAWESTFVIRTLLFWKSRDLILSWIACGRKSVADYHVVGVG